MCDLELKEIVNEFNQDVLPPFNNIIHVVGFESLCAIADEFGGTNIYIPSKKNLFKRCIAKQIKKEFNGGNVKALCKKYDLCQTTVRQIVTDKE